MELNSKLSIRLLALSFWLVVFSCRVAPEDVIAVDGKSEDKNHAKSISLERPVLVKINFFGVEKENNNSKKAQSNKFLYLSGKSSGINSELTSYTQVIDGGGAVEVENIIDYPENNDYLASLGENSALDASNTLPNGAKYKILVYKKDGNSYAFYKQQIFAVGDSNPQIELIGDKNYTLIVVSEGTGFIPDIVGENDLQGVYFAVNQSNINAKILYQRIDDFIPNGNIDTNKIDIKLKNKTTSVRIILDSSDAMGGEGIGSGRELTYIADAKISYKKPKQAEFRLHDATQMISADTQKVDVEIGDFRTLGSTMSVTSDFINNIIMDEDNELEFSVVYKTYNFEKSMNIVLKGFKLGTRQSFIIKLRECGAYLGLNRTNWRAFMCHNLGADYSSDPFTPSDKIHGDKYQWGIKYPIVKQSEDVYESPQKMGWNRTNAYNTWNMGMEDPCPNGWRIPTSDEWQSVLNNNKEIKLGNWSAGQLRVDNAGVLLGYDLMLPAAGKRFEYGNTIDSGYMDYHHATMATVWSSTDSNDRAYSAVVFKNKQGRDQYEVTRDYKKLDALPLRCIKKE